MKAQQSRQIVKAMESTSCQGWHDCQRLLTEVLNEHPQLPFSLQKEIQMNISSIGNLMTLLLVSTQTKSSSYSFRSRFQSLSTAANYVSALQWLNSQSQEITQQSIEMVLESWGPFVKQHLTKTKADDLKFFLKLLNRYTVKRERQITVLVEALSQLQQLEFEDKQQPGVQYETKEMAIMRLCCEILKQDSSQTGNLGLVFDDFLLDTQFKSVNKFVGMRSEYLLQLNHNQLLQIFEGLTRCSLSYPALSFFQQIARLLILEEQFFKLRHLYEQWVLPKLARGAKCCRKPKTSQTILSITSKIAIGFIHHCQLGKAGLDCLLANITHVQNKTHKIYWIALSSLVVAKQQKLQGYFKEWLIEQGQTVDDQARTKLLKDNQVFELSNRSIRERKQPKMEPSLLKGIINNGNQCYIISVVQALFMTKRLPALIEKSFPKTIHPNISCLKTIFMYLSSNRRSLPEIEELKAKGPEQFASSEKQEDAQNYLIRLLEKLEKEFKSLGLLEDFKGIFELQTVDILACSNCPYKTDSKQEEYVHTIPHTQELSLEWREDITDYPCPQCKKRQFTKHSKLIPKSQLLLVHINRFSVHKGNTRKELPTQTINRRFGKYQLVGMIFHIGKKIEFGHYMYYSRIDRGRWAEMNDRVVREFQLDEEEQPFELQMKAEKTPYILVYKLGTGR